MKMEKTECSETSAYKIQTPRNYPEENIQHCVLMMVSFLFVYEYTFLQCKHHLLYLIIAAIDGKPVSYNNIRTCILHKLHFVFKHCTNVTLFTTCKFLQLNLLKPTGYVMHQQFNIQQL